jgi:hypothetical protein
MNLLTFESFMIFNVISVYFWLKIFPILIKVTDIPGKCSEDCTGKEKLARKYLCWDALLVPFHRRSHQSGETSWLFD